MAKRRRQPYRAIVDVDGAVKAIMTLARRCDKLMRENQLLKQQFGVKFKRRTKFGDFIEAEAKRLNRHG
jgi:hypothetical protein